MERPPQRLTAALLALNRIQFISVTCLLTGYGCLRGQLNKMGIYKNELLCRVCNEEKETSSRRIRSTYQHLLTHLLVKQELLCKAHWNYRWRQIYQIGS